MPAESAGSRSRTCRVTDRHPTRRDVRVAMGGWTAGGRSDGRRLGIEPPRRVPQVAAAHDVVAFEHGTGLVAGQLHGHALRHAGPREAAHGGPTEVVRDATGTPGRGAGLPPRLVEPALRDPLAGLLARRVAEDV